MNSVKGVGESIGGVVFPKAQHCPSETFEGERLSRIASEIGTELVGPEVPVDSGTGPVDRTAMPEAAVDKHGYAKPDEYDVDVNPFDPVVHPVSQTCGPQGASERQFSSRVALPYARHDL